ncbi:ribonuclease P protein component [Pelagibacterium lacus]
MPEAPALPMRRLKKRAQFLRAARGTRVARRGFVLQAVAVADPAPGVGYTVTKKVGNAPQRNRIKRRLREAVRACAGGFSGNHDYVLIGRRESLEQPFEALTGDLAKALGRIHGQPGGQGKQPARQRQAALRRSGDDV